MIPLNDASRRPVNFPRDRIRTVLLFGWFAKIAFIPAALLIVLWFLLQLISVGVVTDAQGGGVAYLAHIGGTIYGVATARLFEGRGPVAPPEQVV
jgi:membrane associated rhomboid family serine protease